MLQQAPVERLAWFVSVLSPHYWLGVFVEQFADVIRAYSQKGAIRNAWE